MKLAALVAMVLVLGFVGWYLISPLFITIEVDDAAPVAATNQSGIEELTEAEQRALTDAMAVANATASEAVIEPMPTREPVVSTVSEVVGTAGHPAMGSVRIIETANGPVIRYEDFETINGPQLHLYLATDLDATEYVDLGPVRGTRGNINYAVPPDVNLSDYQYVMYWCVPFGILFNYAELPV